MSRLLGMAACQLEVVPGKIEKNMKNMVKQVELIKYYSPWVKIVVASELIIPGSSNFEALAQTVPGPISDFCSDLAKKHNIYLIPGSMYEKKGDNIYNSSPVFDDKGNIIETYQLYSYDVEVLGKKNKRKKEKSSKVKTYSVQKGDTLYSISRKFDITIDALKRYNGLVSNTISIGQELYVHSVKN